MVYLAFVVEKLISVDKFFCLSLRDFVKILYILGQKNLSFKELRSNYQFFILYLLSSYAHVPGTTGLSAYN